jgi:hypothetical protein
VSVRLYLQLHFSVFFQAFNTVGNIPITVLCNTIDTCNGKILVYWRIKMKNKD